MYIYIIHDCLYCFVVWLCSVNFLSVYTTQVHTCMHYFTLCVCRYELTHSKYVDNLPAGKHSTKGLGRTAPTTDGHKTTEEGVVIPMGKGSSTAVDNTSLLYMSILFIVCGCCVLYLCSMSTVTESNNILLYLCVCVDSIIIVECFP